MAVAGAINARPDQTRRRRKYPITLTFSGNYANSGTTGDLLSFLALTNNAKVERPFPHKVPGNIADLRVLNQPAGYVIKLVLGSSLSSAVGVRVFQTKDPGDAGGANVALQELANGAYPAGLTNDTTVVIEVSEEN